jgi:RimJ/RimL family protein N-acetyltransferase
MRLPTSPPSLSDGADLVLRGHVPGDLAAIIEQCQDPQMQRWTTIPNPYTEADARWFLGRVIEGWEDGTMTTFAIEVDGRFAGSIDLHFEEGDWAEVGFGLAAWARGRHVMRRALALVLRWGFDDVGLEGITWKAHVGNIASRKVAEACGFRVEGEVRGLCIQRGKRVDAWIGTLTDRDMDF